MRYLAILALLATNLVHAHSGGTDRSGCHTNRKTGNHHCHNRGQASALPRNSYASENGLASLRTTPPRTSSNTKPFANCTEARAAGAAPVHQGEPGYGVHLDRDNDGIGCESYRGQR